VPLRARTQRYPAEIRNDQLLVWHDVEGSEPDLDILPPVLPGIEEGLYTPWSWEVVPITDSHCRELIDNVVDMAHFYYVHFSFPTSFRNVFEGTVATQYMESKGRPDKAGGYGSPDLFLKSEATYFGPSYMINWLDVDYKGFETEVILINCHIPTGPDSFTLQYGITVKKPEGIDDDTAAYISKKYAKMFGEGFLQDVHIWKNKVPVQNPLLCEEDGPVYQLRRWYEQYYVDKADVVPEMVDRFEFEVDTTKANEYWQEEVAENLRLRAEEEANGAGGAEGSEGSESPQIMSGT
jgi:3-ketosteroid 9alpha-monooxygenase subunit A